MITEETLTEWEAVCQLASPEKYWKENYAANNAGMALGRFFLPMNNNGDSVLILADDSYFIVEARKHWPEAIAEIKRLRALLVEKGIKDE